MNKLLLMTPNSYLIVMIKFIALRFAFMGSHDVHHLVLFQESPGHVGAEVGPSSSECIGNTSFGRLWVAPQNIKNLEGKIKLGISIVENRSRWLGEIKERDVKRDLSKWTSV